MISFKQNQPIQNQAQSAQKQSEALKAKHEKEDHIIKKTPLIGARITADKLTNDVLVYAPKGLKGSPNSNFYEFLSLGLIPNLVGSATLIGLFNLANKKFSPSNALHANKLGKQMAIGVVLYTAGKWLGEKVLKTGVHAATGIDVDMPYKKVVNELPDYPGDKDLSSVEFHRVFESVDFPRWDLLYKMGEEKGDRQYYYRKIAKRMGYDENLNAPDQAVQQKIREVVTKTTASKNIAGYIWAATGVALSRQVSFDKFLKFSDKLTAGEKLKSLPKHIFDTFKDGFKSLWKGTSKASGAVGKGLIILSGVSVVAGVLNTLIGFRADKHKNSVDLNQNYEAF